MTVLTNENEVENVATWVAVATLPSHE